MELRSGLKLSRDPNALLEGSMVVVMNPSYLSGSLNHGAAIRLGCPSASQLIEGKKWEIDLKMD